MFICLYVTRVLCIAKVAWIAWDVPSYIDDVVAFQSGCSVGTLSTVALGRVKTMGDTVSKAEPTLIQTSSPIHARMRRRGTSLLRRLAGPMGLLSADCRHTHLLGSCFCALKYDQCCKYPNILKAIWGHVSVIKSIQVSSILTNWIAWSHSCDS